MQSVNKFNIAENINLYYINDTKYKTVSMTMYLHRELSRKEVTKNALLAKVLRRGTQKYNTIKDINTHLENLYGSLYSIDISKKADVQSISCTVSNITDKYGEKNLSVKNVETMLDFVFVIISVILLCTFRHETILNGSFDKIMTPEIPGIEFIPM